MDINPIGIIILKHLLSNGRRNRKITRGNMSREIRKSYSVIYQNSKQLLSKELILYNKIDNQKQEIILTQKGEEYIINQFP